MQTMKILAGLVPALGLSLLLGSSAMAAEQASRGFYVGAMGGQTNFDDDGMFDGYRYDDTDSGYTISAGFKALKYLALEARYSDFGFDATAVSAHAVGIIPFGTSGWQVFGQAGLGEVDLEGFDTRTVFAGGIGVGFYPTPHLGLTLQTDAYVFEEDDYNPAFGATQFGIHYIF
jgi:hypothetical protein